MLDLNKDVKYVKTVGPNRVKLLNKLNIYTLKDLITYFPRDYEDRSKPKNLYECVDGEEVLIEAMATGRINEMHKGRMTISRLIVKDQTGTCYITWFNQGYLRDKFQAGRMYRFFGKISNKNGRLEMNSPVYDEIDQSKNTGRIIPIYPLTYELKQSTLRKIMENGLAEVRGLLPETLPEYIIKENKLWDINSTIERIHFPVELSDFNKARERLVFEELLTMQLALLKLKNNYEHNTNGIQFDKNAKMSDVINELPFKLTKAQLRVLEEIDNDMESNKSMNRLLQGDVGSGKTVVAMISAYKAVKSGYQATIMAPTAILASQHLEGFKQILDKFGIRCELLISSITKKKKEEIEVRNNAESLVYNSEKTLGELGDKISGEEKSKIEAEIESTRKALDSNNTENIKEATERLTKVFYEMSEQLYKNANPNGGVDPNATASGTEETNNNDGNVYDADYKVEDDDKK